jgi:transposase
MLADEVDFVIGVDTDRDRHALAVVAAARGVVCRESMIATTPSGYRAALELANQHAPGRRVFALEGSGCYGRGLARFLAARDQRIVEVERPRRERRPRAKSDALDVIAAARAALSRPLAAPRAGGTREALRVLVTTREGAIAVRRAGLNQLRALLVAAPEPLRAQLRTLTRARLLARCTRLRPQPSEQVELRASKLALRSCARRVRAASEEARELDREIDQLVRALAPSLLDEPGVGPVSAAPILLAWSHQGRLISEAAFARLAGAAPIPASSGQTIRYRLDRGGDRQLNRALHTIVLARRKHHPETIAYLNRRTREGKTPRETIRCLKRYLARHFYRLLEANTTTA